MRERYITPLILILGLTLYYPALTAGTFVLDDGNVLAGAQGLSTQSLWDLFFTGQGGTYYRPILMLSYIADLSLWGMRPGFLHLTNILIHLANTILIYLNVRIFYPQQNNTIRAMPLVASLVFLVHPINTESVNWISGRTDPLAALFILIAIYFIIRSIMKTSLPGLWLASFCMVLGSMTKEVAFFSFPAITLFLLYNKKSKQLNPSGSNWAWRLKAVTPMLFGGSLYLLLRSSFFKIVDKGVTKVIDINAYTSPLTTIKQAVTDFGFYIKKLFVPQPLSLAIDHVDPNYFWFGVLALIFLSVLLYKRNYLSGVTLLITLTIFPALLNATLHIAWTPYAERYLYLPAALLCIALALPAPEQSKMLQKIQVISLLVIFFLFLPTTVNRNRLWAEPLELTRLTHQQNPGNPTVWTMYAVMLANQKFYDEARAEFNVILEQYPDHLYANDSLASMEMYIGDPDAARRALERFFNKELEADLPILQIMLECNRKRLEIETDQSIRTRIRAELMDTHLQIYKGNNQAEHLLAAAELAVSNNDKEMAKRYLRTLLQSEATTTEVVAKASARLLELE
jgi:tetratricopeptide (TPR) repeat protein